MSINGMTYHPSRIEGVSNFFDFYIFEVKRAINDGIGTPIAVAIGLIAAMFLIGGKTIGTDFGLVVLGLVSFILVMALVPAFYSWCNVIVIADGNILVQDRSGGNKKQISIDQVIMVVVRPKVSYVTIAYSDPEILVNVPNSTKVFLKDRCEVLEFVLSFVEVSPELKQKVALQKNLGVKPKPNRSFRAEEIKRFIFS